MRIVLVYDQLHTGGTEKLVVMIANLLHEHRHQVTVVLTRQPAALDKFIHPSVPVIYLNRKSKFSLRPMKVLADTCRNADVVHIHTYYNWRYVYFSSLLFKFNQPKFILHEHSDMKHINAADKMILPKLSSFIAVNDQQAQFAKRIGIASEKVFTIPNVVRSFQKLPATRERKNRLLMVGNIRREKKYELALDILAQLPASVMLDVFGNVNDVEYFKTLQKAVHEKQLQGRVHFISNENNVEQHFINYDFALHTASSETGPLVVLEYLSAGLPFFCSTAGQSPTMIAPLLPQVIVASYDAQEWVKRIDAFYRQSPSDMKLLNQQIDSAAQQLLDIEQYYQSLMKVYAA